MAYQLDPKELVDFRELLMANTIQVDTMYPERVFHGSGVFGKDEGGAEGLSEKGASAVMRDGGSFKLL